VKLSSACTAVSSPSSDLVPAEAPIAKHRTVRLSNGRQVSFWHLPGPLGAPTVVLLHGIAVTADLNWGGAFAALCRHFHVLAPDLRPAPAGIAATRIEDYVVQVRAWCENRSSPHLLIGASLGGLLALMIAHDVAPSALVLVNPLPPLGVEPRPAGTDHADVVAWASTRSLTGTRRALADADDATCLWAFRRWRDESGAVLNAAAAGIAIEVPTCPALVLASERDDDVPLAANRAVATMLGADLRVLTGASHVGPLLGRNAAAIAEDAWRWCEARVRTDS